MVGWHHQLNEHKFEQTPGDSGGQWSLACCSPWGCSHTRLRAWTTSYSWFILANINELISILRHIIYWGVTTFETHPLRYFLFTRAQGAVSDSTISICCRESQDLERRNAAQAVAWTVDSLERCSECLAKVTSLMTSLTLQTIGLLWQMSLFCKQGDGALRLSQGHTAHQWLNKASPPGSLAPSWP